jgi:tRNA-uridine 2-sulfurtransferase
VDATPVVDLALSLAHAGSAGARAAAGESGNPACGDALRVELAVVDGRVTAARHRAFGCPHAVAAAELACRLAEGLSLLEAACIGTARVDEVLEQPPHHRECVELAVDAMHAAIAKALERTHPAASPERVAVAMSGGVDSAVALLKAIEAGLRPVGVTLRLWIDPAAPDPERACCSPQSVRAARRACHTAGVPHVTLDVRDGFRRAVVDEYVSAHAGGLTPNPCIRCNGQFRFHALAAFAERIGAARLVTGHYARIQRRQGRPLIAEAVDPDKDQSYMLARVPPALLETVWFPLGDQPKTRTRDEARAAGLEAAGRPESQEVCFVGGGAHRALLERLGGAGREGPIVDESGSVLGQHGGVHRFTSGQRRGLGVSAAEPMFVLRTEPERGRVVIGPRRRLARRLIVVAPGELYADVRRVQARLRYRGDRIGATVSRNPDGFRLELDRPAFGVAPGQAAVLYDGGAVVGAGTIAG